jgi:sacsin
MAGFQGLSLLAYNSAQFQEADWVSIQRIGDSLKKATSKGSKTGRFGIGFNSVYHLTDVPSFASGTRVIWFDPQARFLPGVNPANPGKMIDFAKHAALLQRYPDQFAPLRAFGCEQALASGREYRGTLFRFALRTEAQAAASKLSRQSYTRDSAHAMLRQFAGEASAMLLFLKNVEHIAVYRWRAGASEPEMLHESGVTTLSRQLRAQRAFVLTAVEAAAAAAASNDADGLAPAAPVTCDYALEIASTTSLDGAGMEAAAARKVIIATRVRVCNGIQVSEQWLVCNQLGGGRAGAIATDPALLHMRFVPWAGVAARIARTASGGDAAAMAAGGDNNSSTGDAAAAGGDGGAAALDGRGYCFLPLPVHTQLPVHVNGYFELSSNRRDVWHGDDMAGDGRIRAEWNTGLLRDVAAECYKRLLLRAATQLGP